MAKRRPNKIKKSILFDTKSKAKFIQIKFSDFQKLLEYVEDIEDALELREAKKTAKNFTSLDDIKKELL